MQQWSNVPNGSPAPGTHRDDDQDILQYDYDDNYDDGDEYDDKG